MKSKFVREILGRDDQEASDRLFAYLKLIIEVDSTELSQNGKIQTKTNI
jgi:hypothetical protein